MALLRNETYAGRFEDPTAQQPQGAFKNRTTSTSQDGSYLEAQWLNDWSALFSSMLQGGGITANGQVDTVGASQYYNALQNIINENITDSAFLKNQVSVIGQADSLSTATTSGIYLVSNNSELTSEGIYNYGTLVVFKSSSQIVQEYTTDSGSNKYTRQKWESNQWSDWVRLYSTRNPPTASEVGAYSEQEADDKFISNSEYNLVGISSLSYIGISDSQFAGKTAQECATIFKNAMVSKNAGYAVLSVDNSTQNIRDRFTGGQCILVIASSGGGFRVDFQILNQEANPSREYACLFGSQFNAFRKVFDTSNPPTSAQVGAQPSWKLIKFDNANFAAANNLIQGEYVGRIQTGIAMAESYVHDPSRYKVVLKTVNNEVTTSNPTGCWWSCWGEVSAVQRFQGGTEIYINVYIASQNASGRVVSYYELWESA